jgi:hypothetical protein
MNKKNILAESANCILTHNYEYARLLHKQSNEETAVGDHYGDPGCGLIAPDETWRITGGEGLVLWVQQGDMWVGFRTHDPAEKTDRLIFKNPEDRRWLKSFTKDACQFVHDMRMADANTVRILLDPWSDYASTWLLDIETKTLTKIADGPSMQDQPWTDDKIEF